MSSEDNYYRGRELMASGHYPEAILALHDSLATSDHFKTRELLAVCYRHQGAVDDAVRELRAALLLNPRSNKTEVLLAEMLSSQGQFQEAARLCQSVLARSPDYGPARSLLGKLATQP
jgi:tetratricopeptide (TPR) repeat protein